MNWQNVIEKDTRTCIRFYGILFATGFFAAVIVAPFLYFFTTYEITGLFVFTTGVIIGNRSYHAVKKYEKEAKEFSANNQV